MPRSIEHCRSAARVRTRSRTAAASRDVSRVLATRCGAFARSARARPRASVPRACAVNNLAATRRLAGVRTPLVGLLTTSFLAL
eukprot:2333338-Pleurochrysis_carterae.AAC.1